MLKWRYTSAGVPEQAFVDTRRSFPDWDPDSRLHGYLTLPRSAKPTMDAKLTDYGFLETRCRRPGEKRGQEEYSTRSLSRGASLVGKGNAVSGRLRRERVTGAVFQDISNTAGVVPGVSSPRMAVKKALERSVSCVSSKATIRQFAKTDSGYFDGCDYPLPLGPELIPRGGRSYKLPRSEARAQLPQRPPAQVPERSVKVPERPAGPPSVRRSHSFRVPPSCPTPAAARTPCLQNIPEDTPAHQPPPRREPPPALPPRDAVRSGRHAAASDASRRISTYSRTYAPEPACEWSHQIPDRFHFTGATTTLRSLRLPDDCTERPDTGDHPCGGGDGFANFRHPAGRSDTCKSAGFSRHKRRKPVHTRTDGLLYRSASPKSDIVMGKGILKISIYLNFGMLTVHVNQARHLQSTTSPTCTSRVKISLVPDDTRRTKCSTSVVLDTNHPVFEEKFSFELMVGDTKKRVLISVWNTTDSSMYSEFLGCMSFGVDSIFKEKKQINDWYYLLREEYGRKKHLKAIVKRSEADYGVRDERATPRDIGGVISGCVREHLQQTSPHMRTPLSRPPLPERCASMRTLPSYAAKLPGSGGAENDDVYLMPLCCPAEVCREPPRPTSRSAGHLGNVRNPTARLTRSLSVMNIRTQGTTRYEVTPRPCVRPNTSVAQDSFFSIPTPDYKRGKPYQAPRIVYVDKKQKDDRRGSPMIAPSSQTIPLDESSALLRLDNLEIDLDNTYESLDFLDRHDSCASVRSRTGDVSSTGGDYNSKRKRDSQNDSILSNTSVKHAVKRRKVDEVVADVDNDVPLPQVRKWKFRDSFRFAIFGKKRGKRLL